MSNGHWPKLGEFPLTNAIGVATLAGWLGTGVVAILFATITAVFHVHALVVPAEWWDALKWFSAYAFLQFSAKRASHADLWKRDGNASAPAAPKP